MSNIAVYNHYYMVDPRFTDIVLQSLGESFKRAISSPTGLLSEVSWKGLAWYCFSTLRGIGDQLAPSNLLGRGVTALGLIGVVSLGLLPSPLIELTEEVQNWIGHTFLGKQHKD